MTATLDRRVTVATCIACGARHGAGDPEHDCADVPIDLVEAADVDALEARLAAVRARVTALRAVAAEVAAGVAGSVAPARRARAALRSPIPPAPDEIAVVEAWGCPECGRVDAPQPCLGVCVHVPVLMADARELREVAGRLAEAQTEEAALVTLARFVAQVRPRPGREAETAAALAARARAVLDA